MTSNRPDSTVAGPDRIADNSRHERNEARAGGGIVPLEVLDIATVPDSMSVWMERYLTFAVTCVRSPVVATKIALHLSRFRRFFEGTYGHTPV